MRTGQWLVHNLLSGSECVLDDDEVTELNSANEREYDNLPQLLADFTEMGITVLEETDENACLKLERKIALYSFATNEVGFVIAPTNGLQRTVFLLL